ncbi:MAG: trypsin-like peptidase domain-containing protein [Candidatus Pacebacteria bacterium]|nr:trypsin-like peptidase domain-containing protein [Candidatus Paceibacterota bacterium]
MDPYESPKLNSIKFSGIKLSNFFKNRALWSVVLIIFLSSFFGFLAGMVSYGLFYNYLSDLNIDFLEVKTVIEKEYILQTSQEQAIIKVVNDVSPAVVSIVISKDVPIMEQYLYNPFEEFEDFFGKEFEVQVPGLRQNGTEKKDIGWGTGFIVSEDGMVLTNKHVVLDTEAEYTVFTSDGKKYPAKVLARDPVKDIAVLRINQQAGEVFPKATLGSSGDIQIGQTVVAIGNALGEFKNTVSVGVVSGLGRTITAFGEESSGFVESLEDVIQTDAAINKGNSGGPLLNLKGEVIGINTAMVEQAQSIGFAIPVNQAKRSIEQVKASGKIVYPFLGVRYVLITEKIKKENDLGSDYGAWLTKGLNEEPAIESGSGAEKAGLKEDDIILEINGEKITVDNSLSEIIMKYNPGDSIVLKVLRNDQEKIIEAVLGERSSS